MDEAPTGIDTSIASPAPVYDYLLGGKDNFAADRAVGDTMLRIAPHLSTAACDNRAFLAMATRSISTRHVVVWRSRPGSRRSGLCMSVIPAGITDDL